MELDIFKAPQPFVQSEGDKFSIVEKTRNELKKLHKPCMVVGVCGPYRSGKSYLMNRLAGQSHGFELGKTVQSHTKGIWIWAREHPTSPHHYLLLVDTEGIDDVESMDEHRDNKIFSLTVLMSSLLIYNLKNAINHRNIMKLNVITTLAGTLKTHSERPSWVHAASAAIDEQFDRYFPVFVLTLRDFELDLEIDGKEVNANAYMEHCLKLGRGKDEQVQKSNNIKTKIRKYFRERHCFVFDVPCNKKKLLNLENVPLEELSEEFQEQVATFTKHIYDKAPCKMIEGSYQFNGTMLVDLTASLVNALNDGKVATLEDAMVGAVTNQNERVMHEVVDLYRKEMSAIKDRMPVSEAELIQVHLNSKHLGLVHLAQSMISDPDGVMQQTIKTWMEEIYNKEFKEENQKKTDLGDYKRKQQEEKLRDETFKNVVGEMNKKNNTVDDKMKFTEEEMKKAQAQYNEMIDQQRQMENARFDEEGANDKCAKKSSFSFIQVIKDQVNKICAYFKS